MTHRRTIICVIGTRPEAIKMAPVVRALQATAWARCVVVATAQHRDLLDQMLQRLDIGVGHDLDLMQEGQRPSELLARMLPALENVFVGESPAAVLAQGDTTTVFGAALAAFNCRIPFGHVQAGLRTNDLAHPFPEEGYRQMASRIARWNFAPTQGAAPALQAEGIAAGTIHVTGNTCIDTLLQTVGSLGPAKGGTERLILLATHRRESFGAPLRSVFEAVRNIVERFPDARVVYPVHPNPNVPQLAREMLTGQPRIELGEPMDYFDFVELMRRSTLILTDSGGIQEEAPALGKPRSWSCATPRSVPRRSMRACREWSGRMRRRSRRRLPSLLQDDAAYRRMSRMVSPYGDGFAGARIAGLIEAGLDKADT